MGSTKNILRRWQALDGEDMSTSITSPVTNVQFLDNISIQLNFTGTPTGTFDLQMSDDYVQDSQGVVIDAGNWISIPGSSTASASGSADQIFMDINQVSSPWVRVVYTRASGTGSLDMFVTGKEI